MTFEPGYEAMDLLDLTLQEDGSFGVDPGTLDINVFDDQGLGTAGLPGVDPDMQEAPRPRGARTPALTFAAEDQEVLAVEFAPASKYAMTLLGGLALGLFLGSMGRRR